MSASRHDDHVAEARITIGKGINALKHALLQLEYGGPNGALFYICSLAPTARFRPLWPAAQVGNDGRAGRNHCSIFVLPCRESMGAFLTPGTVWLEISVAAQHRIL
jgi:hypothetical protein